MRGQGRLCVRGSSHHQMGKHSPRPAGARLASLHIAMATSGTGVTLPSLRPEAARKGFEALIVIPFPHTAELRPPLNLLTAVEHRL